MTTAPKPYVVRTDKGTLLSEHDSMAKAQARADTANRDAERLGIMTRYAPSGRDESDGHRESIA